MKITYPHVIDNGSGETLTFTELIHEPDGDKVIGENRVLPKSGPPMHVHWLQDEGFTILSGTMGYQVLGEPEQFANAGETFVFKRGVPHKFWNAGEDVLQCRAWVKPAHNIVFFLTSIFAAQRKSRSKRPSLFDTAYLLRRYRTEFDMLELPVFVKKVVLPVTYFTGKLLGKYNHFKDAPEPIRPALQ
jgi:quercetin dioxygenase-like cupin family protein